MKNLSLLLVVVLSFFANNFIAAQSFATTVAEKQVIKTTASDVEILKNFQATKDQKKVIKKVKKYVSPRILDRGVRTAALEGKTVKLQMGLDAQGNIEHLVVVDGIEPKLNEKVVSLVKEYSEKSPFAETGIAPTVIQMEIPITSNKYYGG